VTTVGRIEDSADNAVPTNAITAIRAISPKAVPFLLEWMPHRMPQRPVFVDRFLDFVPRRFLKPKPKNAPSWDCVETAWRALGSEGKAAIPTLAHIINQPERTMDDYSAWTDSAKALSYLGPDAIIPMLKVATNMRGQHDLWERGHALVNCC
jgi:hypothetical protein